MYLLQKIIRSDLDLIAIVEKEAAEIQRRQNLLDSQMAEIKKDKAALVQKRNDAEEMREQRAQKLYKAEEEKRKSKRNMTVCWRSRITSNPCCRAWKPLP